MYFIIDESNSNYITLRHLCVFLTNSKAELENFFLCVCNISRCSFICIAMQYYVFITRFWEALALKRNRIGDLLACEICVHVGLSFLYQMH